MRVGALAVLCAAAWISACSSLSSDTANADSGSFVVKRLDDRVDILLDGRPLTAFQFNSKWDKPFLYPLRTVSGLVVSRGWPVDPRPGEQHDHAWHRGLWYGHGDINGEDFWREKPDGTTARLVVEGAPKVSSGGAGVVDATLAMMGAKSGRLGTLGERYEFRRDGSQILIDATIRVSADQGKALRFGDSDDGGFGFRLADEFRQDRGAELMNSDRLAGTEKIWGKPAKWVKYAATSDGKRAGVAMLDHPSNLRHPTAWHARGYSLCSANPFAAGSFAKDKSKDGSYTLPAGQTLRLRYLVVVFEGELPASSVDQLFTRFAEEK
jgi:hypothetical protein